MTHPQTGDIKYSYISNIIPSTYPVPTSTTHAGSLPVIVINVYKPIAHLSLVTIRKSKF
jgi:hypothetical protein